MCSCNTVDYTISQVAMMVTHTKHRTCLPMNHNRAVSALSEAASPDPHYKQLLKRKETFLPVWTQECLQLSVFWWQQSCSGAEPEGVEDRLANGSVHSLHTPGQTEHSSLYELQQNSFTGRSWDLLVPEAKSETSSLLKILPSTPNLINQPRLV